MLELKQLTFKEVLIINNLIEKEDAKIENMIYEVRGKQVMLVSDVAKLYHVETRIVNQTIKRNINRFPEEFCFQLTSLEWESLRSQFVISNDKTSELTRGGVRYLPYVLTEHGIIMLSGLLKSDLIEYSKILINHENRLSLLESTFDNFKEETNHIFFEGQIYDVYSLMIKIFESAKENIVIIDNYINKNILDILSKTYNQEQVLKI